MGTVLVTGGAGYMGSHTVKTLRGQGYDVVVLDNLSSGHRAAVSDGTLYVGDIGDGNLVEDIVKTHRIEAVIHFAGLSLVGQSVEQPDRYWEENVSKTNRLLSVLVRSGVKRFVYSSSASVYGVPEKVPVAETEIACMQPLSPYGSTKLAVEQLLPWLEQAYGLKWTALRYFNAAGASLDGTIGEDHRPETHLIPLIMQAALGKKEAVQIYGSDYPTEDGTCIRDYVHVVDLAEAHVASLKALERENARSQSFNVGSGKGYSVRQIIDTVCKVTERHIETIHTARRPGDPPVLIADIGKIRRELGWEPRYSDLETIVDSAWRWHSSNPNGYYD